MENKNQRIIFDTPEDKSPMRIIAEIMKMNGIINPFDDVKNMGATPKIIIIENTARDLYDKKLSEEKLAENLQKQINITKENAVSMINGLKEKLLPFAKYISSTNNPVVTKSIKTTEILKPPPVKTRILESTKIISGIKNVDKQNKEPDVYRESIN